MVRWWCFGLALACAGCGDDGRYTGYVAVSDVGLFGVTYTTGCQCPNEPPRFGDCSRWSDAIPPCDCATCDDVTTIRLPDETLVWSSDDDPRSYYAFWYSHGASPGDDITYEVDGCHGSFSATLTVPDSSDVPLSLDSVVEIDDSVRLRWSPAGGDAAITRAGSGFAGARCLGPDTGEGIVPERLYPDSYVGVRTLYRTGAIDEPHAAIDLYRAAEVSAQPPNLPLR